MATPEDDDLNLKPEDAGVFFRAEMALSNLVLGYWKLGAALVAVVLVAALLYGQYYTWVQRGQKEVAAAIFDVERKLELPLAELPFAEEQGKVVDPTKLAESAKALAAIADGARPPGRIEARLKAAELFRLAGDAAQQRTQLEDAAASGEDLFALVAELSLAQLDLDAGQGDAAVQRLERLSASGDAFQVQEALLELGLACEHLGRKAEAAAAYDKFLTQFPENPRGPTVRERKARLGSGS
jgi:tetratricopeptide (TPR) repeat protein